MDQIDALENIRQHAGKEFTASRSPFTHWLKPVVVDAEKGKVIFRYTVRQEMTNPMGTLHGGVTAAIMDDTVGAAVFTLNEDHFFTTINNAIDYFVPAREADVLIAEGLVIKKGRQIVNAQFELWNADRSRLLARGYSNLLKTDQLKPAE